MQIKNFIDKIKQSKTTKELTHILSRQTWSDIDQGHFEMAMEKILEKSSLEWIKVFAKHLPKGFCKYPIQQRILENPALFNTRICKKYEVESVDISTISSSPFMESVISYAYATSTGAIKSVDKLYKNLKGFYASSVDIAKPAHYFIGSPPIKNVATSLPNEAHGSNTLAATPTTYGSASPLPLLEPSATGNQQVSITTTPPAAPTSLAPSLTSDEQVLSTNAPGVGEIVSSTIKTSEEITEGTLKTEDSLSSPIEGQDLSDIESDTESDIEEVVKSYSYKSNAHSVKSIMENYGVIKYVAIEVIPTPESFKEKIKDLTLKKLLSYATNNTDTQENIANGIWFGTHFALGMVSNPSKTSAFINTGAYGASYGLNQLSAYSPYDGDSLVGKCAAPILTSMFSVGIIGLVFPITAGYIVSQGAIAGISCYAMHKAQEHSTQYEYLPAAVDTLVALASIRSVYSAPGTLLTKTLSVVRDVAIADQLTKAVIDADLASEGVNAFKALRFGKQPVPETENTVPAASEVIEPSTLHVDPAGEVAKTDEL